MSEPLTPNEIRNAALEAAAMTCDALAQRVRGGRSRSAYYDCKDAIRALKSPPAQAAETPEPAGVVDLPSVQSWHLVSEMKSQCDLLSTENARLRKALEVKQSENICGLCGKPGADKIPHPIHWPGERVPDTEYVHADCESEECGRAHAALTDDQRKAFLKGC